MPKKDEPISGKIADIVTKRNAVINRGSQDGVEKGMRFRVLLSVGTITDPDDPDRKLGGLTFTKANIKVTAVYRSMSYCAIEAKTSKPLNSIFPSLSFTYPDVDGPLLTDPEDWHLRRGDKIKQIIPADKE